MPLAVAQRIMRRIRRNSPGLVLVAPSQPTLPPPAKTNERDPRQQATSVAGQIFGPVRDNRDRLAGYREYRLIDAEVPEGGASLDAIVSVATTGEPGNEIKVFDAEASEEVEGHDVEQTQAMVDGTIARLGLRDRVPRTLRTTVKLGDAAWHVIVDQQGTIIRLRTLAPDLLFRAVDRYERPLGWIYKGYSPDNDQWFLWDWEVIHLPFLPEDGEVFGRSLFWSGGRGAAFQLMSIRDSTAFQAINNAAGRNAYIFGLPIEWGPSDISKWRDQMHEDLYRRRVIDSNGRLDRRAITAMDEEHQILNYQVGVDGKGPEPKVVPLAQAPIEAQVKVLEHFRDIFTTVCRTPRAYLNIESGGDGLGSSRSDNQETQFLRLCNNVQMMGAWLTMQVIERQALFIGEPLPPRAVKLTLPDLSPDDEKQRAELRKINAEAAKIVIETGFPASYAWVEILYDGDHEAAKEGATLYGFNLEEASEMPDEDELEPGEVESLKRLRVLAKDAAKVRGMLERRLPHGNTFESGDPRPDVLL